METNKQIKSASIITIIDNVNFGTYLQAMALAKTIENFGISVHIIDYCRKHQSFQYLFCACLQNTCNPLKWGYRIFNWYKSVLLRKKDKAFLKDNLTKKQYFSYEELKKNPPYADVYITGSDQVWNSIYNKGIDRAFYLDFVPDNVKRIAYAASIGMEQIPDCEKMEIKKYLSKYNSISVREKQAEILLKKLQLPIDVRTVLDPTLLLSKEIWNLYALKRLVDEPYMILYSVETKDQNKLITQMAKKIAKVKKIKIVGIYYGGRQQRIEGTDKNFFRVTPSVFLSLFLYADYCIVSSFHGTAFSINFQKNFLTITPGRFNSRVDNLLTLCNLKKRLVVDSSYDINDAFTDIDYSLVNKIIEEERQSSIDYLRNSLLL